MAGSLAAELADTLAAHVVIERAGTWLSLDDAEILDAARTTLSGSSAGEPAGRH